MAVVAEHAMLRLLELRRRKRLNAGDRERLHLELRFNEQARRVIKDCYEAARHAAEESVVARYERLAAELAGPRRPPLRTEGDVH